MKASVLNLKTIFTLSILVIALTSCEKDDKLESPDGMVNSREHSEQWALNNDSAGLTLNHLESLPPEGMYQKKVFKRIKKVNTYMYGSNTENFFEWFEAEGNNVPNRPLIILAPGGGWKIYNEVPKLKELAEDLALRGYSVALIRYFIDPNTSQPTFDEQLKSVRDMRSAVRYFKLNAGNYNIDSDNIFIGGWSTGAVISMAAAYIEDEVELLEIAEQPIRDGFLTSVNNLGFDNNDNPGADNNVRGVLGMFAWTIQKTFIDAGEPSLMMINHSGAHFGSGSNKVNIIGKASVSGGTIYGTDTLNAHAISQGYVTGQDLDYIRMTGPSPYKGTNEACLHNAHWDGIADFFYRNMKE